MVNVLLSLWNFGGEYLRSELEKYIKPSDIVAIVSFAHKSDNEDEYELHYRLPGKHFLMPVLEFEKYGVSRTNILLLDYYMDSFDEMKAKINKADIIMFTGGMPDKAVQRLKDRGIIDTILSFDKVVMGYSAGAIMQLRECFLSPDHDYPELIYMEGLPFVNDFYIEVHYEDSEEWKAILQHIKSEKNMHIYAIGNYGAIIVDEQRKVHLFGDVTTF